MRNGRLEEDISENEWERKGRHSVLRHTFLAWICWMEDRSVPRRELSGIFITVFPGMAMCFMGLKILSPCLSYKVFVQPPIESKVFGHRNLFPHRYHFTNGMKKSFSNFFGPINHSDKMQKHFI